MDKITKEIFRSWNWPSDSFSNFTQRPTPYKISKMRYLNLGVVYKSWNQLFDRGDVRKVYLLPEDWFVDRRVVILPGVGKDDLKLILPFLEKTSFLEMVHFGHIYFAKGNMEVLKNGCETLFLELVDSSDRLVIEQISHLLKGMSRDIGPIHIPYREFNNTELNEKLLDLARKIAYSDIYRIDINSLAEEFLTTPRTVVRRIDTLIDMGTFRSFPFINQSVIAGTNVMVVNGQFPEGKTMHNLMEQVFSKQVISENYLLYRVMADSLNLPPSTTIPPECWMNAYQLWMKSLTTCLL